MQVSVEYPAPCTAVVNIELDEAQVARAIDGAYREFGKVVNVPGFRPGKAPRNLVQRYADRNRVMQNAMQRMVNDTLIKALEEQDITPFGGRSPELTPVGDLVEGSTFTYQAKVSLNPEVTLGAYTGLTVKRPIKAVKEEDIDKVIQDIQTKNAKVQRVTDRGIVENDVVIAELKKSIEGEPEDDQPARRQLVYLGENPPGFDEAIMGMENGEERSFQITVPEDYQDAEIAGKTVNYHLKVTSISGKALPELNDEFAKEHFDAPNMDEARTKIRQVMEENANRNSIQYAEQALIAQIIKNSTINFPEVLVIEEMRDEFRQLSQKLKENNLEYGTFLNVNGITQEQHQQMVAQRCSIRVTAMLALREMSLQEGLQPSEEDIDNEFTNLMNQGVLTEEMVEEFSQDDRRRMMLGNSLIESRLHNFLFANNTIEDEIVTEDVDPDEIEEELLASLTENENTDEVVEENSEESADESSNNDSIEETTQE